MAPLCLCSWISPTTPPQLQKPPSFCKGEAKKERFFKLCAYRKNKIPTQRHQKSYSHQDLRGKLHACKLLVSCSVLDLRK